MNTGMMIRLRYGNTNTFYIPGEKAGLLVDTDYAGTIHAFYKALKMNGLRMKDIGYVNEKHATVITCEQSRAFLAQIGIFGEVIRTPSHSADSVSLILDDGDCFVGDLEPAEYLEAYEDNRQLKVDWELIRTLSPSRVFYAHAPEKSMN